MIFLLTALIIITFAGIIIINKKNILEPSTIFTFSFLLLTVMASINYDNYQLNIGINTFLTILLGIIEFDFVCLITKHILNKRRAKKQLNEIGENDSKLVKIEINKVAKIIFLCLVVLINIVYIFFMVKAVNGSFNSLKDISAAISKFDSLSKFSDNFVRLPSIVANARIIIIGAGYWFIYVVINNIIVEKKIKALDIIIIVTIFLSTFLSGSRGNALFMLVAAFVFYMYLATKHNSISKRFVRGLIIVICSFVLLFSPIAKLLGRNINQNFFEYMSIYCGAEVKNLDIFLNNDNFKKKNELWGSQTFNNVITTFGDKIGFEGYKPYKLDLPFQKVNGKSLGNVYTTFYPYIYDFGYIGYAILVALMAVISQLIYEGTKRNKKTNKLLMLYAIVYTCLLLSFFSNKFYENLFNVQIIKYVLAWYICDWVFINKCRIKIKKKEKNEEITD